MKAIYNRKLTKREKQACQRYIVEELQKGEHGALMRFLKVTCVVLHDDFGFGRQRLEKYIDAIDKLMTENQGNEILWDKIDEVLIDKLGLPFECEDYEEREEAMRENARKRNM